VWGWIPKKVRTAGAEIEIRRSRSVGMDAEEGSDFGNSDKDKAIAAVWG
jgi:hypothetical protein